MTDRKATARAGWPLWFPPFASPAKDGAPGTRLNRSGDLFVAELGVFELFVALFYGGTGLGLKFFKQGQETPWIEGFQGVIGALAGGGSRGADEDYRDFGLELLEGCHEFFGGHVFHTGVQDYSVEGRIFLQGFDGFFAAVGGDDIEFCGFYDEFPRRDAA